jgi:hypothetical protein
MHQCNVSALSERIAIDISGLFKSLRANQYLLIAMDCLTKWPKVHAIPNQEALKVADVLVTNFFCHSRLLEGTAQRPRPELQVMTVAGNVMVP